MPLANARSSFVFVPVLAVLALASLVLFNSLETESQAENARQLHFMKTAAFQVVDDLGYELFSMVSAFSFDLNTQIADGTVITRDTLTAAVARYRAQARFPSLFEELACLERTGPGTYRFDSWNDSGWVTDYRPSWAENMVVPPQDGGRPESTPPSDNTFSLDRPVLTVYLRNRRAQVGEVIAITLRFRPQTVIGTIVPALVSQRFSESNGASPYIANIIYSPATTSGDSIPVDWRVPLLPWTPFEGWFDYYVKRISALQPSRTAFDRLAQQPVGAKTEGTGWNLEVSRLPGGLLEELIGFRWRNGALSLGFFLVLGLGFLGLYLTTRQTRLHEHQVRTFLALVSHELKTPLAVVQSLADNLSRGIGTDEARAREYGVVLRQESDRLGRMVNNILGLTAIQGGISPRDRCPIEVSALVKDRLACEPDLQDQAADLTVNTEFPTDLPLVLGHHTALSAAIDNLVGNAFRHGTLGPGPHLVELRLRSQHRLGRRGVSFSVRDNGPGFTRREGRRFRRPFRRGQRASQEQTPGSGVGLSLVYSTAESLGGHLSWKSQAGRGSQFVLWLPAVVK